MIGTDGQAQLVRQLAMHINDHSHVLQTSHDRDCRRTVKGRVKATTMVRAWRAIALS